MNRGLAYSVLAEELSRWRQLPTSDLARLVGVPAATRTVELSGELVSIEVTVSWATPAQRSLRIEAVANGPSSWRLERAAESVVVSLSQEAS